MIRRKGTTLFKNPLLKEKSGAVWVTMVNCASYLNLSLIADESFNETETWLLHRMRGRDEFDDKVSFTDDELLLLADIFDEIGMKLIKSAASLRVADN